MKINSEMLQIVCFLVVKGFHTMVLLHYEILSFFLNVHKRVRNAFNV